MKSKPNKTNTKNNDKKKRKTITSKGKENVSTVHIQHRKSHDSIMEDAQIMMKDIPTRSPKSVPGGTSILDMEKESGSSEMTRTELYALVSNVNQEISKIRMECTQLKAQHSSEINQLRSENMQLHMQVITIFIYVIYTWWPHNYNKEKSGHFRTFHDIFRLFARHLMGKNQDISGDFSQICLFIRTRKPRYQDMYQIGQRSISPA